jgi:hypothetical protein
MTKVAQNFRPMYCFLGKSCDLPLTAIGWAHFGRFFSETQSGHPALEPPKKKSHMYRHSDAAAFLSNDNSHADTWPNVALSIELWQDCQMVYCDAQTHYFVIAFRKCLQMA